ncbi:MAG TPA: hypothetical protein VIL99_11595 [Ignavibacteria bacterium]
MKNYQIKLVLLIAFVTFASPLLPKDIIKVGEYTFQIGMTTENFLAANPEYAKSDYIDDRFPGDIVQYTFNHPSKEIIITVGFYNNSLFYVYIDDQFWSGLFNDFEPENFGFKNTGEETEPSGNNYFADIVTEFYQKENISLKLSRTRFGFLEIEKAIDANP